MRVLLMLSMALVAGCAAPEPRIARFNHPSASDQQYMQDRYQCIREAQKPLSGAYVNAYGGSSGSTMVTSFGLFTSCMGARGYSLDMDGRFGPPPGGTMPMVQ